jgi:hypothetical protein
VQVAAVAVEVLLLVVLAEVAVALEMVPQHQEPLTQVVVVVVLAILEVILAQEVLV